MKKQEKDLGLDRLKLERDQLIIRAKNLMQFCTSDGYLKLERTDRELLDIQYDIMMSYLNILNCRIRRWK